MEQVKYYPVGDRAMLVEFGRVIDEGTNNEVQGLSRTLVKQQIHGVTELQPTIRSLMIYYDPELITYSRLRQETERCRQCVQTGQQEEKKILMVPCCYGARFGCDLKDMEEYTGLDRDEIIAIHSGIDYKIYMLGFLPGFVYLGGLDSRIHMPRLDSPRLKIAPGAVGIGGSQTGIYPMESPGGWRLIGGTPIDLYDPYRDPATLCEAGMYIRFVPITVDEFYDIRREVVEGRYQPEILITSVEK